MQCDNCGETTTHIKYYPGIGEMCPNCSSMSENTLTDSKLTRTRVRMDSLKFEGDTLSPRKYDKIKRRVVPNEDFIRKSPGGLKNFFTPEELKAEGYSQLADRVVKQKQAEKEFKNNLDKQVEHHGDAKKAVREFIKGK